MLARKVAVFLGAVAGLYFVNIAEPQAFRGSGVPSTPAQTFRSGSGVVSQSGGTPSGGGFRVFGASNPGPAQTFRSGGGPGGTSGAGAGAGPGPGTSKCVPCASPPSLVL